MGASCCNTIKSNQMVGADRRKPSGKGAGGITEAPCQRGVINGLWKKSRVHLTVSTEKWEKMAERCFIRAPNGRISQHPDSPGDSPVFTPEGVNHRPRGRSHRPEVHAHSPLQLPLIPQLCGSADFRRMNGKGRHSSFTSKRDLRGPETFPHLSPLFSYWSHGDRNT